MSDAAETAVIRNGPSEYVLHLFSNSDGSGESGVAKVDISALTAANGKTCTYTSILTIQGSVWGGEVRLHWDHTTDDEIAILSGQVNIDWSYEGGKPDPRSAGGSGDILLTTNDFTATSGYDLTIRLKKKN